jgi:16S rRNA (adenine1518-N6/adenine1519-N6)-dimethyltransferase
MVQYEVAKRIKGKKGTKDYGILSVLLNFFADVRICFKVSPSSFYPKPKVDSAVIHLFFKEIEIMDEMKSLFIQVVKASFGNRRKTLKNSLSNSIFGNINFEDSGIDLTKRAEQLDIEDFLKLSEFLKNYYE